MNRAESFFVDRAHKLFGSPEPFRAFLLQQPVDAIVGFARDACSCPLATFAKSQRIPLIRLTSGHLDIDLCGKSFTILGVNHDGYVEHGVLDTEDAYWFSDFVNLVDRLHPKGVSITAARSLLLLNTLLVSKIHPDELTEEDLTAADGVHLEIDD